MAGLASLQSPQTLFTSGEQPAEQTAKPSLSASGQQGPSVTMVRTAVVPVYETLQVRPQPMPGKLVVANVPVRDRAFTMVKVWPSAGTKPLASETFRAPLSVAAPPVAATLSWSYWVPAVVPPISTSSAPSACCV